MRSYLILAGVVAFTVFGDYALKHASMKSAPLSSYWFIGGVLLYASTAYGWMLLMQNHNLAQIAVIYSSTTILALTGVGYAFFGESISLRQALGISAALISVFLMESDG
ncbi:hypothetical protein P775_16635 [Puniceibacterium antarcticum]|uniref:EamA domain-containing protein n=1 Tax=Puniceibacterium antarcticum TaxID=1206336 RepID=A0A2G8RBY8_9RHOB|nr:transporter [Puniceibacterium antarcticum]PIL19069.1 hypothetical protein P775_16635 [Puniceibacterium antarcticum]